MFRSAATRSLRASTRAASAVLKRGYAEAAATDKLTLSLAMPHDTLYSNAEVVQVNLPATSGDFGVLANHVPTVEELRPGLVEVIESAGNTKQIFIAGGVATVQPNSHLNITTVEAFPLDAFSPEAIKANLAEAQKNAESADETVAAEAAVEVEVLETLAALVK